MIFALPFGGNHWHSRFPELVATLRYWCHVRCHVRSNGNRWRLRHDYRELLAASRPPGLGETHGAAYAGDALGMGQKSIHHTDVIAIIKWIWMDLGDGSKLVIPHLILMWKHQVAVIHHKKLIFQIHVWFCYKLNFNSGQCRGGDMWGVSQHTEIHVALVSH